ncbi:MAG: hypothetical protein WCP29_04150 [Acidobacteriota bacterium]
MRATVAWSLLLLAWQALPVASQPLALFQPVASVQPVARSISPEGTTPSSAASIFRVDPATRLDQAPAADTDAGWARLARVSNTATVTVHLDDGSLITGTIQRVDPASLDFVASRNEVSVPLSDITPSAGDYSKGQDVDLRLRDGTTIKGTILDVAPGDSLRIIKAGGTRQLKRQDILKVSQDVRMKMRLLGMGVGIVAGLMVDIRFMKNKHSDAPPAYFILLGGAGYFAGPRLRSEKILWDNAAGR